MWCKHPNMQRAHISTNSADSRVNEHVQRASNLSMKTQALLLATALAIVATAAASAATRAPGWFGVAYTVHANGFFNPTIESITIASVRPDSPASEVQLGVGDEVLAVDDHPVSGTKARDLRALMSKSVGEVVHLSLKRATGELYTIILVAVPVPED